MRLEQLQAMREELEKTSSVTGKARRVYKRTGELLTGSRAKTLREKADKQSRKASSYMDEAEELMDRKGGDIGERIGRLGDSIGATRKSFERIGRSGKLRKGARKEQLKSTAAQATAVGLPVAGVAAGLKAHSDKEKRAFADAEDIPWYTTAAGATGGLMAAKKFLPKKYQGVGQIGGALLGTAAGLGVGKPLAKKLEKKAEAEEPKPPHPALTAAKTVGGLGVGMLAGYGGMKAIDAGLQKVRGRGLPKGNAAMWAVPLAAGAGGLAYSHLQQRTLDKMREDHLKRQEMKRGSKDS